MKKPLNTAFVYEVWKQHARGEISFSRMVELLNEEAIKNTENN